MILIAMQSMERQNNGSPRLLVVDDDADIRLLIRVNLEPVGYEIHEAGDGGQALRQLQARQFDGVVLDLRMPGIDGYAVLSAMRAQGLLDRTPVLTCSAHTSYDLVESLSVAGVSGHVAKPFKPVDLVDAVARMLAGGRAA